MLLPLDAYPVRPKRVMGESMSGYLYRFLHSNGHVMGKALKRELAVINRQQLTGGIRTYLLDLWTRLNPQALQGFDVGDPWLSFSDERDDHEANTLLSAQGWTNYCPKCIEAFGFHQLWWDIPYATICLHHNAGLVEQCDACESYLTLVSLGRDWTCTCGKPITEMRPPTTGRNAYFYANWICDATDAWVPECQTQHCDSRLYMNNRNLREILYECYLCERHRGI